IRSRRFLKGFTTGQKAMEARRLCETTLKLPQTESEVCEWLQRQNLLRRCPFDDRLDRAGQAKWLNRLTDELGARYVACTLTNFDTAGSPAKAAAVERLQRFAESMPDHLRGGGGLMLYGNPGTGKDHLVAALLKIAIAGHRLSAK